MPVRRRNHFAGKELAARRRNFGGFLRLARLPLPNRPGGGPMETRGAFSMTIGTSRRGLFGTSALAGALALSIASGAVAQERVYSIPAQSLAASLRDYGMASGEQIIFAETIVSGRQAPALQGAYASDDALRILLADSGLTAERVATGGIMIRRADGPQSGSAAGDGAGTVEALIVTAQKREED